MLCLTVMCAKRIVTVATTAAISQNNEICTGVLTEIKLVFRLSFSAFNECT